MNKEYKEDNRRLYSLPGIISCHSFNTFIGFLLAFWKHRSINYHLLHVYYVLDVELKALPIYCHFIFSTTLPGGILKPHISDKETDKV